jgi:hypothetical protein
MRCAAKPGRLVETKTSIFYLRGVRAIERRYFSMRKETACFKACTSVAFRPGLFHSLGCGLEPRYGRMHIAIILPDLEFGHCKLFVV